MGGGQRTNTRHGSVPDRFGNMGDSEWTREGLTKGVQRDFLLEVLCFGTFLGGIFLPFHYLVQPKGRCEQQGSWFGVVWQP